MGGSDEASSDLLDRLQSFLDAVDKNPRGNLSYEQLAVPPEIPHGVIMWADVQMLVAIVRNARADDDNPHLYKEFLDSADRAVRGWKRANTNQIESIGNLQEKLRIAYQAQGQMSEENARLQEKVDALAAQLKNETALRHQAEERLELAAHDEMGDNA